MKTILKTVDDHGNLYDVLMFVCPGCVEMYEGSTGLHMLPVNSSTKTPSWVFDGNLEAPTLSPSILTTYSENRKCHSYLRAGVFEYLSDCTHQYVNQLVPIPDLPIRVEERKEE